MFFSGAPCRLRALVLRHCNMSLARALSSACLAVAMFAPAVTHADDTTSPLSLSLDDALRRAHDRAPELRMSRGTVREAEARRVGVGKIIPTNPRLAGDLRPPITGGTWADVGYSANLEVPFDLGGAPGARAREAEQSARMARTELSLNERSIRADVWSTYIRAASAAIRITETQKMVQIAERIVGAARERALKGASGDIDVAMATGELAQLAAVGEGAKRQRDEQVDRLRELLDIPALQEVNLTTDLKDPPPASEAAALIERALSARPEFANIKARIALAQATQDRLSRELFPRIGIYAGVDAAPVSPIFGMLGLSMELPFFQRQAGLRAAIAETKLIEAERLQIQGRQVAREVSGARRVYESRRAEFRTLTEVAVPAAERTLDLVEIGWLAGRFDIFRMTAAARDVARVRNVRLEALEAAWVAHVELDRKVGGP